MEIPFRDLTCNFTEKEVIGILLSTYQISTIYPLLQKDPVVSVRSIADRSILLLVQLKYGEYFVEIDL